MERDDAVGDGNTSPKQTQIDRLEVQMHELKQEMADVKSLLDRRLTDLFALLASPHHHASSSSSSFSLLPTSSLSTSSASLDTSMTRHHSPSSGKGPALTDHGSDDETSSSRVGTKQQLQRRPFKRDLEGIASPKKLPLRKSMEGLNGIGSSNSKMMMMSEMEGEDEEAMDEEEEDDTMGKRSRKRRRVEFEDGHLGREDVLEETEAETESESYLLQRLPVEVWTHILSFVLAKKSPFASLSATMLTCKLWRRIGLSLVTSYTMSPMKPKKLARKCLAFLFGNCPNLRSLRVRNCPIVNSMLYHLPERITLLDCGFTQITEEALEYLPLSLKALSIDNMAITDNGFNDLPARLDTLSLRQVIISPISAKKMAQRFTRLRKLTLSAQVTNVTAFLPPSIECLRLHVGSIGDKNYLWNDNVIATLLPLPNLQILEISRCNITNSSKQTLAETRVRHLVIRQAKLSDEGMRYLPPTLVSLMLESVPTITDAGLRGMPLAVQSVALIKMEKLTAQGLLAFLLEAAGNLRYLVLDEDLHASLRDADVDRKLAARRNLHISVKRENEPCPKLHQLPVHHLPPPSLPPNQ